MLTDLQKKTGQAIVNVFESGKVAGNYGAVAVIPGDTGGLSYGRSQASLMSGSLYKLINSYCQMEGAQYAAQLSPDLPRMRGKDPSLNNDSNVKSILRQAGADPVMQQAQDQFFDQGYWNPAVNAAEGLGIQTALGTTIVYDSFVQGCWGPLRGQTTEQCGGTPAQVGEQIWCSAYVQVRYDWLANNSNAALHPTVYRMETFQTLIGQNRWALDLPIVVRGVTINQAVLDGQPGAVSRTLRMTSPPMTGSDVQAVQTALVNAGYEVTVDRVYGPATAAAVKQFQQANGLSADGAVGPLTLAALGLSS